MASSTKNGNQVARVSFVSLGCPKNLVDSEKMLGVLKQSGFELVNEDQRPDAIVVNTCGFLEASKDESLEVIHDAIRRKEKGEIKRVVVAGCLVQRHCGRHRRCVFSPGCDQCEACHRIRHKRGRQGCCFDDGDSGCWKPEQCCDVRRQLRGCAWCSHGHFHCAHLRVSQQHLHGDGHQLHCRICVYRQFV